MTQSNSHVKEYLSRNVATSAAGPLPAPTLALIFLGFVGTLALLTLPVLFGGSVDRLGPGDRAVGWLAAAIAAALVMRWVSKLNWRHRVPSVHVARM